MEDEKIKPRRSSIKERVEILTRKSSGARPNSVDDPENEEGVGRKRRSTYVRERAMFINNKIKEGNFKDNL